MFSELAPTRRRVALHRCLPFASELRQEMLRVSSKFKAEIWRDVVRKDLLREDIVATEVGEREDWF